MSGPEVPLPEPRRPTAYFLNGIVGNESICALHEEIRFGRIAPFFTDHDSIQSSAIAMWHLDCLSYLLTVAATLLCTESWVGLGVATINSLILCEIARERLSWVYPSQSVLHLHIRL